MPATKTLGLLIALGLNLAPAAGPARAAESATNSVPALPRLRTESKTIGGPGMIPTTYACVRNGASQFAFQIPPGLRLDVSAPDRVMLTSADLSRTFDFRVLDSLSGGGRVPEIGACREVLFQQHAQAKIIEEFSLPALGGICPAIDFQWTGPGGVARRGRAVFIPVESGVLEFSLESNPAAFPAARQDLNSLLTSLQTGDGSRPLQLRAVYGKS
jgi:hypothetical protein